MTGRAEDANFSISFNRSIASMFHHPIIGVKVLIGEVDMNHPNSNRHWSMLRRKAFNLAGGLLKTKIVIPADRVYYSECYAPGPTPEERVVQIRQGLIGRTGYNENVSELVFDWFGDGDTVQVAVVGKDTLREADGFATSIGLNPVAFSASPDLSQFGSEPFFDRPTDESDFDSTPSIAGRRSASGRESGRWSISKMIGRLGKRRDRNAFQYEILSNSGLCAKRRKNCAQPKVGEPLYDVSSHACTKVAEPFRRLLFGEGRSKTAELTIIAILAGAVQIATLTGPSVAQETTPASIEYAPQLRPLVLEPPVVLRPDYLNGSTNVASVENTSDLELDSELIGTNAEDQLPTDIAGELASGPPDLAGLISPEFEPPVTQAEEASRQTADLGVTVEETANDTVTIDSFEVYGSAILPEVAEPKNPQVSGAAQEEAETIASGLVAPPEHSVSVGVAAVEYGPPQRPKNIVNAPARVRRSAASNEPQAGPPSRPQNLQTFSLVRAVNSSSQKGKSHETVSFHATENRAIRNTRLVLIGVMGKSDQMKALVRLKGGKLVSVSVGDALDGGQVKSINSDHIVYSKGMRTRRLTMPD